MLKTWFRRWSGTELGSNVIIISVLLTAWAVVYFVAVYWRDFVNLVIWMLTPTPGNYKQIAPGLIIGATFLGFVLYRLRSAARVWYGVIEILFGVGGIAFAASTLDEASYQANLLQVAAGTYIIVRGLDNLKIGLDQSPSHPMWVIWNIIAYLPLFPRDYIRSLALMPAMWRAAREVDRLRREESPLGEIEAALKEMERVLARDPVHEYFAKIGIGIRVRGLNNE